MVSMNAGDNLKRDAISNALITRRAEQFALLKDLIRIDTSPHANDPRSSCDRLCTILERLGFEVERHTPPSALDADGQQVDFDNIVVRRRFGEGPTVGLVCHIDTFAPVNGWSGDPFSGTIGDGVITGLGSVSGKGHLACFVFAAIALMDSETPLSGTLEIHVSLYGERGGKFGAAWLLSEGHVKPDSVIVGGPAQTVIRHATGALVLTVDVRGVPAPAFAPGRAKDPVEAMANAMTRLFQFRTSLTGHQSDVPGLGAPALMVEEVKGGSVGGGIPGSVSFVVRRTILPGEDTATIETQLTKLIGSTIAKSPGVRARIKRTSFVPPMMPEAENMLADMLIDEIEALYGDAAPLAGVAFETEARHYASVDVPTVIFGAGPLDPSSANMHEADEALELDLVRKGTQVLAFSLARYLGADPG